MTQVIELMRSQRGVQGDGAFAELVYKVIGEADRSEAISDVASEAPATFDGMPLRRFIVEPGDRHDMWEITAFYSVLSGGSSPSPGEQVFSFDTSGGTQRITHAIEHIASFAPPGEDAPDHNGAINVTQNGIEGVEVPTRAFRFQISKVYSPASFGLTQINTIRELSARVNSSTALGFPAGELLFINATGGRRGVGPNDPYEITYNFAWIPNASGVTVAGIDDVSALGHHYVWVEAEDAVDDTAGRTVKRAVAVHVEQVLETGDLNALGLTL